MMEKENTKFATRKAFTMKKTALLKKWLTDTCAWFTVITLLLMLIPIIFKREFQDIPNVGQFLFVLPFSMSASAAWIILKSKTMSAGARRALHYLITLSAFYLFLWLPAMGASTIPAVIIALFLLSLLYWIFYLIGRLAGKRFRSFREED